MRKSESKNRDAEPKGMTVRADWQKGMRTRAWDELWAKLLEQVLVPMDRHADVKNYEKLS